MTIPCSRPSGSSVAATRRPSPRAVRMPDEALQRTRSWRGADLGPGGGTTIRPWWRRDHHRHQGASRGPLAWIGLEAATWIFPMPAIRRRLGTGRRSMRPTLALPSKGFPDPGLLLRRLLIPTGRQWRLSCGRARPGWRKCRPSRRRPERPISSPCMSSIPGRQRSTRPSGGRRGWCRSSVAAACTWNAFGPTLVVYDLRTPSAMFDGNDYDGSGSGDIESLKPWPPRLPGAWRCGWPRSATGPDEALQRSRPRRPADLRLWPAMAAVPVDEPVDHKRGR